MGHGVNIEDEMPEKDLPMWARIAFSVIFKFGVPSAIAIAFVWNTLTTQNQKLDAIVTGLKDLNGQMIHHVGAADYWQKTQTAVQVQTCVNVARNTAAAKECIK